MDISFDILPEIFSIALLMLSIFFFLYKKYIYSILDPLVVFVVSNSFASVLAIYVIPDTENLVHFFLCQVSFFLGFILNKGKQKFKTSYEIIENPQDIHSLKNATYIFFIIYLISNFIIGSVKGFALLSESPTEAKIASFQQGFGFFRKINWSVGTFVVISLTYLYLHKKHKVYLFLLLVATILSSLDGSKASLLKISSCFFLVLYHPIFVSSRQNIRKIYTFLPIAFLFIFAIFFLVLIKENETSEAAFLAFIKRLLYSADSVLYFYQPINIDYFKNFSFGDYIDRITIPILGFFRIKEYIESPGNIMIENLLPPGVQMSTIVGPNAPFYIEGKIYFNYWLAFPYCALIGYTYSRLRTTFFTLSNASSFRFVYYGSFLYINTALFVDVNLAITQSFDLFFFVMIPYLLYRILTTGRINIYSTVLKNLVKFVGHA